MIVIRIHHVTTYRYRQPVRLLPHRLLVRPRESRELRVRSFELSVAPKAAMSWAYDVFGNALVTATFEELTESLVIESSAEIELHATAWPIFPIAASAMSFPFMYSNDEWIDLGALTVQQYPDPIGRLRNWARSFLRSDPTDTLAFLKDLSTGVSQSISYQSRDEEGTQTPTGTLARGWGSCRDFAILFAEATRSLGFGARIVSGYVYTEDQITPFVSNSASTHAWAEVFVPGAGWIAFDPTNRSVGGFNLIPVAVARDIRLAMPVVGSFDGMNDAFLGMDVDVRVSLAADRQDARR